MAAGSAFSCIAEVKREEWHMSMSSPLRLAERSESARPTGLRLGMASIDAGEL